MAKVLTLQQRREAAMAASLETMKQRLAEIEERKRLYNEQEAARIAALTPEEKATEEAAQKAHAEAVRQIQIETAERRASAIEPRHSIIHLQDEE